MALEVFNPGGMQPWNQVIFPSAGSNWPIGTGVTASRLKAIPAIGRGLAVICGMAMQMPLDDMKGDVVLPRPRLLDQPDPDRPRAWFVGQHVEDYLVHGNAVHVVTSRDAEGYPVSALWLPAERIMLTERPDRPGVQYWLDGRELHDVVHVRRGADPNNIHRGVGVLEQFLPATRRLVDQEHYEAGVLNTSGVPSVVVETPNPELSQTEADEAADRWIEKFQQRRPAILPLGTKVTPLAWSPHDSQMVEARKLGLTDAANMLNLDGYWLGAESGSYTYKTPGPMYLNLIRQTVGPIVENFEGAWSSVWLPRGRKVAFTRQAVMADDMETTVRWVQAAVAAKLMTKAEGRIRLGLGGDVPEELNAAPETVPAMAGRLPADDEGEEQ